MQKLRNHLLAALPNGIFQSLQPHLKSSELVEGRILVDVGDPIDKIYFPENGIISLVVPVAEDLSIAAAMIGHDGVFGAFGLDGRISVSRAVVQVAGIASTLDAQRLQLLTGLHPDFLAALIHHETLLFAQAQQAAACNAVHPIQARVACWLLRVQDLSCNSLLRITQDLLARMIGVQRNSVSLAASSLMRAGAIQYSRGVIEVIDRDKLQDAVCECYEIVKTRSSHEQSIC